MKQQKKLIFFLIMFSIVVLLFIDVKGLEFYEDFNDIDSKWLLNGTWKGIGSTGSYLYKDVLNDARTMCSFQYPEMLRTVCFINRTDSLNNPIARVVLGIYGNDPSNPNRGSLIRNGTNTIGNTTALTVTTGIQEILVVGESSVNCLVIWNLCNGNFCKLFENTRVSYDYDLGAKGSLNDDYRYYRSGFVYDMNVNPEENSQLAGDYISNYSDILWTFEYNHNPSQNTCDINTFAGASEVDGWRSTNFTIENALVGDTNCTVNYDGYFKHFAICFDVHDIGATSKTLGWDNINISDYFDTEAYINNSLPTCELSLNNELFLNSSGKIQYDRDYICTDAENDTIYYASAFYQTYNSPKTSFIYPFNSETFITNLTYCDTGFCNTQFYFNSWDYLKVIRSSDNEFYYYRIPFEEKIVIQEKNVLDVNIDIDSQFVIGKTFTNDNITISLFGDDLIPFGTIRKEVQKINDTHNNISIYLNEVFLNNTIEKNIYDIPVLELIKANFTENPQLCLTLIIIGNPVPKISTYCVGLENNTNYLGSMIVSNSNGTRISFGNGASYGIARYNVYGTRTQNIFNWDTSIIPSSIIYNETSTYYDNLFVTDSAHLIVNSFNNYKITNKVKPFSPVEQGVNTWYTDTRPLKDGIFNICSSLDNAGLQGFSFCTILIFGWFAVSMFIGIMFATFALNIFPESVFSLFAIGFSVTMGIGNFILVYPNLLKVIVALIFAFGAFTLLRNVFFTSGGAINE